MTSVSLDRQMKYLQAMALQTAGDITEGQVQMEWYIDYGLIEPQVHAAPLASTRGTPPDGSL